MLHKKEGMTVHIQKNKIIKNEQLLTCIVVHRGRKSLLLLLLQGRHSLVLVTVKLVPAAITTFQDNQSFVAFTQYSSFPAYKLTIGSSFGEDRGHIEDSICVLIYKASDRQRLKKKSSYPWAPRFRHILYCKDLFLELALLDSNSTDAVVSAPPWE